MRRWRGPDILVNNAGVQRTVCLAEITQEIWHEILAVNLSGAFHTMRRALPEMAKRGYRRVINIASVHGVVASVNKAPYAQVSTAEQMAFVVGALRTATCEQRGYDRCASHPASRHKG